ncbi:MAG: hypothetical protein CMP65_04165 [Flavobacteriales bacterium]|nr:hypothetical protein [Flavobacteriales bacterium]|tara:strand:- start:6873 stop:8042 length:1170 start_codon:yes stop_codon:yes gene_type:complete
MKKLYLFIYFLFTILSLSFSQTHNELLNQQDLLRKEAASINKSIKENQSDQKLTIESLNLLNNKIDIQEKLLKSIQKEINYFKNEQNLLEKELAKTSYNLKKNQENYSKLIKTTYLAHQTHSPLIFFFSSATFNQLLQRINYYNQLENNRRLKFEEIKKLIEIKKTTKNKIKAKKKIQLNLAKDKELEIKSLEKDKQTKKTTINFLKTKEDSLKISLANKENEANKIKNEIIELLEREKIKNKSLTPESKLISDNFAKNKSLLPWPTQEGTIAVNFGERPHPIMPGIKIMNNGIEIATSSNRVRSVFEGEVSKVLVLPNSLKVIILRHGEYFTVYSNLYEVFVDIGDKVSTKQNIGSLYNAANKTRNLLGFQIWQERTKLNPKKWLSSY